MLIDVAMIESIVTTYLVIGIDTDDAAILAEPDFPCLIRGRGECGQEARFHSEFGDFLHDPYQGYSIPVCD